MSEQKRKDQEPDSIWYIIPHKKYGRKQKEYRFRGTEFEAKMAVDDMEGTYRKAQPGE